MDSLIEVEDLFVSYRNHKTTTKVLNGLNFTIKKGQTLVIAGESGSGKSTLGKALSGLLPSTTYVSGKIKLKDREFKLSDPFLNWSDIRGNRIGHIFQDPNSSLRPREKIKKQFYDTLVVSHGFSEKESIIKARRLLQLLNFDDIEKVLDSYSFQLSGGMCQRVSIALSLSLEPDFIIADEITSALDLKSQYELIQLLDSIKKELNTGILFITHDLKLAKIIGDETLFLNKGILEKSPKFKIDNFEYNSNNLSLDEEKEGVLKIKKLSKSYDSKEILKDLSFSMCEGEIFGILGESGCGKSTLAKLISGLEDSYSGKILFENRCLKDKIEKENRYFYKDIQIIFQDERGCLNPYKSILSIVEESIRNLRPDILNPEDLAKECLESVGLKESLYKRKAPSLSTGQCQRVSIARAISVGPKLLILDEVVSALDIEIKHQIMNLLMELQRKNNISMIMISHEIDVLQGTCQRVGMMKDGKVKKIIKIDNESMEEMKKFLMEE